MATETTKILHRNADGTPALWLDIVRVELLHDDGRRTVDYTGTTLNDDNTSIPFDPSIEDVEAAALAWADSFAARGG